MEHEKQKQQQQELQLPQTLNNGDMFVKVMTNEQMEILRKQIAAYATLCEQLEDLHASLISQNDPSNFMLKTPYCTTLMNSSSLHKIPRRQRWNPTTQQLQILERVFAQGNETPSKEKVKDITSELAKHGQIAETNVYNWFQNRRARMKKKQLVVVDNKNTESEVEMVAELSPKEGSEKSKQSEPIIDNASAGKPMCSFDQQGMEMQQSMFIVEDFHGSMSSTAKMHNLVEDIEVSPPECYNPYIHAENYNMKGK